jgi:hypothetical protein
MERENLRSALRCGEFASSEGAAQWLVPRLRRRYPDQLVFVVAGVEIEMGKELGLG